MNKLANSDANQFVKLVMEGIDAWTRAGEIAARAIAENPNFIDEVCDACPDITPEAVKRFQAIGLKKLHPQLAISEAPGVRRLRKLPFALQEQFVKAPIELVVLRDKGGVEVLKVDVRNLTPDQAAQVFTEDDIRSAAEQRAYIEDRNAKRIAPPTRANLPYRHDSKKLIVMEPCTFSRKELAKILAEME